ncbi:MAG: tetratricopeptide repeat protein [Candidatus Krumholzibacteriia bacterium]
MKRLLVIAATFLFVAHPAGATQSEKDTPEPLSPSLRPAESINPYQIMDLICDGRSDSAMTILGDEPWATSRDPMVLLLKARVMRDQLPDEDNNKELLRDDVNRIHAVFDRVIELCDEATENGALDPKFRYYRARAHFGKAQLHTLTKGYWSAGRAGGRAKKDFEEYLRHVPDDPDAQGDLGAFLYFADAIPGVVKFFSKLLFFPSGDREKGLRMIEYAATNNGPFHSDYEIARAAIDLLFDGHLEKGITAMSALVDRYPNYTRLAEPYGVLAPLYPLKLREFQRIEDKSLARHLGRRGHDANWNLVKRMHLHRAFSDMFFLSPATAVFSFTTLIDNPVARPDWMLPLALLNRGILYAKSGRTTEAREAFSGVIESEEMKFFHDTAHKLLKGLDEPYEVIELEELEFVGRIYDVRLAEASEGLERYRQNHGEDVIYHFYNGELNLVAQEFEAAARAYMAALDVEAPHIDQSYQMFAALRLAEIHGHEQRFRQAVDYIDEALKYTHAAHLFNFMVNARRRYYTLLDDGTLTDLPTMLFQRVPQRTRPAYVGP